MSELPSAHFNSAVAEHSCQMHYAALDACTHQNEAADQEPKRSGAPGFFGEKPWLRSFRFLRRVSCARPIRQKAEIPRPFLEKSRHDGNCNQPNCATEYRVRRVPAESRNELLCKRGHDDRSAANSEHHQTKSQPAVPVKPLGDYVPVRYWAQAVHEKAQRGVRFC
jgi:hypothetical protein